MMSLVYRLTFAAMIVLWLFPGEVKRITTPQYAESFCGPNSAYQRLPGGIAQCYDKKGRKTKKVKFPE